MKVLRIILPFLETISCSLSGYFTGMVGSVGSDYISSLSFTNIKVLNWIADRDGLESGQRYMAIHQHDKDANELWLYFQEVISWAIEG